MQLRRSFILVLFLIISIAPMRAQIALSAEVLVAYPFYFDKEEIGITTSHMQKGFRVGAYYYDNFDEQWSFVSALRFTHHFATIDSVEIEASAWNYNQFLLHGSAKTVFNSFIPQFGANARSGKYPLLSYRFTLGIGASWARALYEFPTYDSLTMQYFNPPWYAAGDFNEERKLVAVRPCMMLNFAVHYEVRYFFAFGNLDLSYSMGEFPPTPVSIGAGILVPLSNKNE